MISKTNSAALLQHFWMVSAQVEFMAGDSQAPFHRNFNILQQTDRQIFTQVDLAKAQQLAQHRLVKETFAEGVPEGFAITDVFIQGVSHLGQMTREEFTSGFDELAREQQAAAQAVLAQASAERAVSGVVSSGH